MPSTPVVHALASLHRLSGAHICECAALLALMQYTRQQWRSRSSTARCHVQGQLCLEKGTLVGPPEVGILATIGASAVRVVRKPLVAVLSSGDEVVEPTCQQLGPGQIRDCNRSMLVAAVQEAGASVLDLGIAKDQV